MKKFMKKALTVLMVGLLCVGLYAPLASAETNKVIVHAKDGLAWGSMNVYNWGDDGETAGVWPGTAMTAEADGWYTYTFETKVPLNLVFCAEGGAPQSSNIEGLAADAGEVWVVVGEGSGANDLGAATNEAVLYLEAEEGWPVAAAAETPEVTEDTEATTDTAATTDTTADVPKTGESIALAVTFVILAGLSATAVVVLKRKEQIGQN